MTRGGTAYVLPTSAPLMDGSASSSLLPTPEAKLSDSGPDYARAGRVGSGGDDLTTTLHRLLPTPTVQDASNTAGPSQFDRNSLPLNTIVTLLPTPAVNDMGAGKTVKHWDEWTATMQAKHGNGNGHGKSLSIETLRLLPTPRASDGPDASSHGRTWSKTDRSLHTLVHLGELTGASTPPPSTDGKPSSDDPLPLPLRQDPKADNA